MKKVASLKKIILVILILAAGVSYLLFYDFGKSNSRIIDEILNYGHVLLFGFVALVMLWVLNRGEWPCTEKRMYLRAGFITVGIAIITECIQAFIPDRYFQLADILNDTVGASVFLAFVSSFHNVLPGRYTALYRKGLIILLTLPSIPIATSAYDTWDMTREFPVLSSFESPLEMSRWTNKESKIERTKLNTIDGDYSLKADLLFGNYPGISMDYLTNNWRGYSSMSFEVFLEGTTPLDMTVRINDRTHNDEFNDRFNKRVQLLPGENHICIQLDEVRKAPLGREMDMSAITNICIFACNLKTPRTVYFDNFRLKNRG